VGAVKSFGDPSSMGSSHVSGGRCAICYSCHDFLVPSIFAGNFLGMADGSTWQPKPTVGPFGWTGCCTCPVLRPDAHP